MIKKKLDTLIALILFLQNFDKTADFIKNEKWVTEFYFFFFFFDNTILEDIGNKIW